jgi:hypothetical protein
VYTYFNPHIKQYFKQFCNEVIEKQRIRSCGATAPSNNGTELRARRRKNRTDLVFIKVASRSADATDIAQAM